MSINHEDRKDLCLLFFRDKHCQVLLLIETEQGDSSDVPDALIFGGTDPAAVYASWRQKNPSSALPVLFHLSAGLDHDDFAALLARLMALKPDGLVLTDASTAADSQRLDALLRVEEARAGLADGSTPFIALLGGNPSGFFQASAIAASSARLIGLGLMKGRLSPPSRPRHRTMPSRFWKPAAALCNWPPPAPICLRLSNRSARKMLTPKPIWLSEDSAR